MSETGKYFQVNLEITVYQNRIIYVKDGETLEQKLQDELKKDPEAFIGRIWPIHAEVTKLVSEEVD